MLNEIMCPICESGSITLDGTTSVYSEKILCCKQCGHKWLQNVVRPSIDIALERDERDTPKDINAWLFRQIPQSVKSQDNVNIIDIGCWDGSVLEKLPSHWNRHGVEPNLHAAEVARSKGVNVTTRSIETADFSEGTFDLALMLDVIEHLDNPMETLKKIYSIIKPEGYVIILTGNCQSFGSRLYKGNWYYCNYVEHVTFFSIDSMEKTLANAGFTCEYIKRIFHHSTNVSLTVQKIIGSLRSPCTEEAAGLPMPKGILKKTALILSRIFRGKDHLLVLAKKDVH